MSLLYWEVLFFSSAYQHQFMAHEFLESNPKIAQHFEVDQVLRRAVDSGNSDHLKKVLEITLRHDLDMYNKSKALETLLVFHCDSGNFKSASETIRYAAKCQITVGADAMAIFLEAEKAANNKPGAWRKLKSMFWRNP